jgi:inhibitor of cysteine peptidase
MGFAMRHSQGLPLFLAGFLSVLLFQATPVQAGSADLTLTEKDSGRTVTLQVGEKLLLNLRNPGDGGYNVLPPVFDAAILTFLSRRDLPPSRPRPGDFGRLAFTWQARQPGETDLTVNIARPWEKAKAPAQYVKIRVRVSP